MSQDDVLEMCSLGRHSKPVFVDQLSMVIAHWELVSKHSFAVADWAKMKRVTRKQGHLSLEGMRERNRNRAEPHDPAQVLRMSILIIHVQRCLCMHSQHGALLYCVTKHTLFCFKQHAPFLICECLGSYCALPFS